MGKLEELERINLNGLVDNGEEKINIDEIKREAIVRPDEEIKPPESIIEQVVDNIKVILGTLGNFTLIAGKAKSRKSFVMTIFTAILVSTRFLFGLKGCNRKKVIYFDTEQSRYHVQLLLKRIMDLADGVQNGLLEVYALRKYSTKERLEIIEHLIKNTDNLGVVIIDGIKDLITSINDEEQATMISNKLLKWSEEYNIHIYVVLHQNKSDMNARGHLGTELANKCETYLTVTKSEKDGDISIVEPAMTRNREPQPFAFEIVDGLPVEVEDFEVRTSTQKSGVDFSTIENHKLFGMLNTIFSREDSFSYSELVIQIKLEFKNIFKNGIGDNKAKELITICKNNDWLIQDGAKKPYTLGAY